MILYFWRSAQKSTERNNGKKEQVLLHGIFDSHAHYDDTQFDPDRRELLDEILPACGIAGIVNIGNDYRSIAQGLELAKKYDYITCALGHHPHSAKDVKEDYLTELRELLSHPKAVAVGEIGLDYHYDYSPREVQKRVFREQLELARELDMPVVIHSREATEDTLALLREYRPAGVVHCFSGSAQTAKEILKLDMYLGFTGVVTFKGAKKALEAVAVVPPERLLIETDCPYMAPVPKRGERCDSSLLPYTIAAIAAVKGMGEQALVDITAQNARDVYRL